MATEGFPISKDVLIDGKTTAEWRALAGPSLKSFGEGDTVAVMTGDEAVHSFKKIGVNGEEDAVSGWLYNGKPVELSLYEQDHGAHFRTHRTRLENGSVLGVRYLECAIDVVHHLGVIAAATAVKPASEKIETLPAAV